MTDPDGRTWRAAVSVSDDPTTTGVVDFALVLVKSYQTERAARWARQVLREDGLALTLQNGLDNYPALIRELGPERAAAGVTYTAATMLGPAASATSRATRPTWASSRTFPDGCRRWPTC